MPTTSNIEVRLLVDPLKPTPLTLSRLAVYRKELSPKGRMKKTRVGWVHVESPVVEPPPEASYEIPRPRPRVRIDRIAGTRFTPEDREEIRRQAEKLLPFLDRLWLAVNWDRLSDDLARLLAAVSVMNDLPPGIKNRHSITDPLGKISKRLKAHLMKNPFRTDIKDIPERFKHDLIYKVRWAYEDSKQPVPVEVKEKIIELQNKDVEAREKEKRFYEDWVRRDNARRAAEADKENGAEVVKAEKGRGNSSTEKS